MKKIQIRPAELFVSREVTHGLFQEAIMTLPTASQVTRVRVFPSRAKLFAYSDQVIPDSQKEPKHSQAWTALFRRKRLAY